MSRRAALAAAAAGLLLSSGCRTLGAAKPTAAPAVVLLPDPIDVEDGIHAWREKIHAAGGAMVKDDALSDAGYTECAEAKQIPGTYVCLSFFAIDMNRIFGRASVYAEGGFGRPRGSFPADSDADVRKLNLLVEGQDLKSEDLTAFFDGMRARCARGERSRCLNRAESLFYETVFRPAAAKYPRFVFLSFASQSFDSYQSNLGHELLHAQYMLRPEFKETIDAFWDALPEPDKAGVRKILDQNAYDPHDEYLMRNEFQAYVLEPESDEDLLKEFVPKYAPALTRALAARGLSPIRVR